jgi:hypothetical protein
MSGASVRDIVDQLRNYFFRYYETAFAIRDDAVARERRTVMERNCVIFIDT